MHTRAMHMTLRLLIVATVLVSLAACGNKGPLVRATPAASDAVPAVAPPAATDPTDPAPSDEIPPPPAADPAPATPPAPLPEAPPADESDGDD